MRASAAAGGRSRSHSSQFGRSSSATEASARAREFGGSSADRRGAAGKLPYLRTSALAQAVVGDGAAGLAERPALVPRHLRLVDAAEGGVGIVVGHEVLDLLEAVAAVPPQRIVLDTAFRPYRRLRARTL